MQSAGSAGRGGSRTGIGDGAHVLDRACNCCCRRCRGWDTLTYSIRFLYHSAHHHPSAVIRLRGRRDGEDEGDLHLAIQPQGTLHRTRAGALPTGDRSEIRPAPSTISQMIRCYCARGYCSSSSSDFKERDESFHLRGDSSSFFNHCNCCITHSQLTVFYQGRAHRHSSLLLAMFITFLCCLITLSQLSGQPSVLYFANRIFEQAGLGFEAALFIGTFMLHVVSESSFIIRTCFSQECSSWP